MIELPPEFEADIQGQNLNLFPIVKIETQNISSITDSGVDLVGPMWENNIAFAHDGGWDVFNVEDYVKIDDEYMRVTDTTFGNAHVTRGLFGSDIAYHDDGTDVYLVVVGEFLSTKDVILDNIHYKPLLLNIPSIKESMDFENRKYKISNVTLKVINYEYDGERFSDYAGNLINNSVTVSWVSQSDSILPVYSGFVRRYSHDDETVNLSIEDASQKDLHKDVPITITGDGIKVPDKYKLKPYPMVYGSVNKSPCVVGSQDIEGTFEISCDNTSADLTLDANKLFVYSDSYVQIPQYVKGELGKPASPYIDGVLQCRDSGVNSFYLDKLEDTVGGLLVPKNPLADGLLYAFHAVPYSDILPLYGGIGDSNVYYATASNVFDSVYEGTDTKEIKGSIVRETESDQWSGTSLCDEDDIWWDDHSGIEETLLGCNLTIPVKGDDFYWTDPKPASDSYNPRIGSKSYLNSEMKFQAWKGSNFIPLPGMTGLTLRFRIGGNEYGDSVYNYQTITEEVCDGDEYDPPNEGGLYLRTITNDWYNDNLWGGGPRVLSNPRELNFLVLFHPDPGSQGNGSAQIAAKMEFMYCNVDQYMLLDNYLDRKYYADVQGRIDEDGIYE